MEYKCDMCGAPATVHITKIIDGKKIKMHLCAKCAEKNSALASAGFPVDIIPNIKKLEEQLLSSSSGLKSNSTLICPSCGTTFEEFEKRGRFSCPECYAAFKSKITDILAQMHGAIKHIGKRPKIHDKSKKVQAKDARQIEIPFAGSDDESRKNSNLEDVAKALFDEAQDLEESQKSENEAQSTEDILTSLKSQLESAISDERYEDAAQIRDKINALQSDK